MPKKKKKEGAGKKERITSQTMLGNFNKQNTALNKKIT
jgi:hypothetical protein